MTSESNIPGNALRMPNDMDCGIRRDGNGSNLTLLLILYLPRLYTHTAHRRQMLTNTNTVCKYPSLQSMPSSLTRQTVKFLTHRAPLPGQEKQHLWCLRRLQDLPLELAHLDTNPLACLNLENPSARILHNLTKNRQPHLREANFPWALK